MRICAFLLSLLILPVFATDQSLLTKSLKGETFLFTVDSQVSPDNPNAATSYLIHFFGDTYQNQEINTGIIKTGHYQYTVLKNKAGSAVGLIKAQELFKGKKTIYTMYLVPKDKATGLYIYKQKLGAIKPNCRMNSAQYTRILT